MIIYINYLNVIPTKSIQKFHGGGNYARGIIGELVKAAPENVQIVILYPDGYEINEISEPELFNRYNVQWEKVNKIDASYQYEEESVLYYPVLFAYSDFKEILKIKKKHPRMKIFATVHDVRMFDIDIDYTEKYYLNGVSRMIFPLFKLLTEIVQPYVYRPMIRKCLGQLEQIYTDSNYSMQSILKINHKAKVMWYYPSVNIIRDGNEKACKKDYDYILFVSGSRRLKNLGHALLGFDLYKKKHPESGLKLIVTGIDEKRFAGLSQLKQLSRTILDSEVIHYDYVSNEHLSELYRGCRFILYTSKAEGFGLPVLEAASYGKTCVASNVTSIPEVLGQAVRYVSPKDDQAIADEIAYLSVDTNLAIYEARVRKATEIATQRMTLEQQNLMEDFLRSAKE